MTKATTTVSVERILRAIVRYHDAIDACMVAANPPSDLDKYKRSVVDRVRRWEADARRVERPHEPPIHIQAGIALCTVNGDGEVDLLIDARPDLERWSKDFKQLERRIAEVASVYRSDPWEYERSLETAFACAMDARRLALRLTAKGDAGNGEAGATAGAGDGASDDASRLEPALTENQCNVLNTMARFDGSRLLSSKMIADEMDPAMRLSEETIRQCVKRLIACDLAERPEGERSGARLTLAGRRRAGKIAN